MSSPAFPAGNLYAVDIIVPARHDGQRVVRQWTGTAKPVAVEEYRSTCGCMQIARKNCCVQLSRGGQPLATAWFTSDGRRYSEELTHPAALDTGGVRR